MEGKVFKMLELTGTSKTSIEEAVQTAIGEAAKTVCKHVVVSGHRNERCDQGWQGRRVAGHAEDWLQN